MAVTPEQLKLLRERGLISDATVQRAGLATPKQDMRMAAQMAPLEGEGVEPAPVAEEPQGVKVPGGTLEPMTPDDVASFGPPASPEEEVVPAPTPEAGTPPAAPITPSVPQEGDSSVTEGQQLGERIEQRSQTVGETTNTKEKEATEELLNAQEDMRKAAEEEKKAEEKIADVAKQQAIEEEALIAEKARIQGETALEKKRIADEGQKELERRFADIESKVQELSQMEYKNFWSKRDTGDKITAGLGILIGGIASGITGRENAAMKVINKAMDDDFAQFKNKIDNRIKVIEQSRTSLANKKTLIQNQLDTLEAYKIGQLEQIGSKIEGLKARMAGTKAAANADLLKAQIDSKLAKEIADIQGKLTKETTTTVQEQMNNVIVDAEGNIVSQQIDKSDERYVPGLGLARTKDDAKQLKKQAAAVDKVNRLTQQMMDLRSEYGTEFLDREAIARGKAMASQLKVAINDAANLGAYDAGTAELLTKQVPDDPLEVGLTGSVIARLQQVQEDAKAGLRESAKLRIMTPDIPSPGQKPEEGQQSETKSGAAGLFTGKKDEKGRLIVELPEWKVEGSGFLGATIKTSPEERDKQIAALTVASLLIPSSIAVRGGAAIGKAGLGAASRWLAANPSVKAKVVELAKNYGAQAAIEYALDAPGLGELVGLIKKIKK